MEKKEDWNLELSEYIKQGEPNRVEKTKTWETAIGLQDVDGLKPSKYLIKTAKEHIEGNIDIKEVKTRIDEYYEVQGSRKNFEKESEEADKVAVRIAEILSEKAFNFSPTELLNIHKRLFKDIFDGAGVYRDYNFTKKEWVLNGDTVTYASYETIEDTLEYDFEQEENFSYKGLSMEEAIKHLCRFTSNIWQIHPFCEGNTRTTAVFIIKYLRTFGFKINDEVFADNSWYFRNALVRANYTNFQKNIFEDTSFLEKFFYNNNIQVSGVCDAMNNQINMTTKYGNRIVSTDYVLTNAKTIFASTKIAYDDLVKINFHGKLINFQQYMPLSP